MKEKKFAKVLAAVHQIGSARALIPVISKLREKGVPISVIGYDQSAREFEREGVSFMAPEEYCGQYKTLLETADKILEAETPAVLLTGTSAGENLEKVLISRAKEMGVLTISLLDHWENYEIRFAGPADRFEYLPAKLAIMDANAYDDLVRLGCPPERLVITGQPYFDDLSALADSVDREKARAELGIGIKDKLFIFSYEPHSRDYGKSLGYDEKDALRVLLDVMGRMSRESTRLFIKPHPTIEKTDVFNWKNIYPDINVAFAPDLPVRTLLIAADVVVGMKSMLLIEAALLGCHTISLQPGLMGEDVFVGNRFGLVRSVYDAHQCFEACADINDGDARNEHLWYIRQRLNLDGQAAYRVAQLVIDSLSGEF